MSPDVVPCTKTTSLAIVSCPSLSKDLDTDIVPVLALCQIMKSSTWQTRVLPLEKPVETSDRRIRKTCEVYLEESLGDGGM